jgi:glucose-6-phosphate isomerase
MALKLQVSSNRDKQHQFFQEQYQQKLLQDFQNIINNKNYGFFHLSDWERDVNESQQVFEKFSSRRQFVHVGLGGSSLGPEMLVNALKKK